MKKWKLILTIWLSIGVGLSGYFFIDPPVETRYNDVYGFSRVKYNYKVYKYVLLTTVVGTILIVGIGKSLKSD